MTRSPKKNYFSKTEDKPTKIFFAIKMDTRMSRRPISSI